MSFDLYMFVRGYWSSKDTYLGGESHNCGKHTADGFSLEMVLKLIVEFIGYEENMRKISWFPPETPDKKEDIDDDETLQKVLHYGIGSGAITLYIVREDDPYIGRRIGDGFRSLSDDEADWIENSTNSQAMEVDAWKPWNEGGAQPFEDLPRFSSAPPPQTRGKKRKVQTETDSSSQPMEDITSLSKAPPKRKPGRPRKNPEEAATSSQPLPDATSLSREPIYDIGPRLIPRSQEMTTFILESQ